MPDFAVILPAAGSSTRFGASRNKLTETLGELKVIQHSLRAFLVRRDVAQVVVPIQDEVEWQTEVRDPLVSVCEGGSCRAESVRAALAKVRSDIEWVAVHDAARPLVSQELINRTLAAAGEKGAAAPALP